MYIISRGDSKVLRSFISVRLALSPCFFNTLPTSRRQPRVSLCITDSSSYADCLKNCCHPTIHRSHHPQLPLYHSQLKTHLLTRPSHRKYSPCRLSAQTMVAVRDFKHTRFFAFLVSVTFLLSGPCVRLIWLTLSC